MAVVWFMVEVNGSGVVHGGGEWQWCGLIVEVNGSVVAVVSSWR
jgi:hypothetical protein